MDNFTLSVLIGGIAVMAFFVVMLAFDKKKPASTTGTEKPAGKRSA